MKFNLRGVGQAIARKASMAGFKLKCHSPAILVGVGIVGMVGAAVLACKATPKAIKAKERCAEELNGVKQALNGEIPMEDGKEYTVADGKKDTRTIYIQTAGRFIKAYGPAVILGTLSILSILSGFRVLHGRYIATASTLAAVENRFAEYRSDVRKVVGEEKEDLIFKRATKEIVDTPVIDKETGEVKMEPREQYVSNGDIDLDDPYLFLFDIANAPHTWNVSPGYNLLFLTKAEQECNDQLRVKGYITLNQVLEFLGMQPVDYGLCAGWLASDIGSSVQFNIVGRGAVNQEDLGCYGGGSPDYLLRFNCRGNIQVDMPKKGERKNFGPKIINRRRFA